MRGGVQSEGRTGAAVQEAAFAVRAGPGVTGQSGREPRQCCGYRWGRGVAGSAPSRLVKARPAVAQARVGDQAELRRVGQTAAERVLGVIGRAAPYLALVNYPTSKLANLRDLKVNEPREISYPDADSRACS